MKFTVAVASLIGAVSALNGTYAPQNVSCPDNANFVRNASEGISDPEKEWLEARNSQTKGALQDFLNRGFANISSDSNISQVWEGDSDLPRIAVAIAGGGYRAMFDGAGAVAAMDNRTDGANEHGLGGLLQATTYLAALSGGNWLTGTLAYNDFISVQEILEQGDAADAIFNISNNFLNPYGNDFGKTLARWTSIGAQVQGKEKAGFNVTITDLWSRALAYAWFPTKTNAGAGITWSSLRDSEMFKNGSMPMPISVADGRYPGTKVINLNATVFEMTPFEIGSWDPSLNTFSDIKYLGTKVSDGKPDNGQCISGFDDASFIMGTSSSLFNLFTMSNDSSMVYEYLNTLSTTLVKGIDEADNDIALYAPNPFKDSNFVDRNYTSSVVDSESLFLVDGGEDGQGIPFVPLVNPARGVDIIFAVDAGTETSENYPAGGSLIATYERQFSKQGKGMAFPYIPDQKTFVNLGLTDRPTFFGCDANNLTDLEYIPPLVVYIPISHYSYNSNVSTFKLAYTYEERVDMIRNAFEATTRNNLTDDSDYMTCVSCAIIRRKQQSENVTLPEECDRCFSRYCWNGTRDETPTTDLDPVNEDPAAISSAIAAVTDNSPIGALLNSGSSSKNSTNSSKSANSTMSSSSGASSSGSASLSRTSISGSASGSASTTASASGSASGSASSSASGSASSTSSPAKANSASSLNSVFSKSVLTAICLGVVAASLV
ncbi:lysophospholipase family protein [Nakaseomyces bracarensis]|uniref:lysophospholipase family protein n=1 Tax=Nakaseomyces bracarensis TaxID=273131 RepID=UPI003872A24A